ncbi:MULTISPECIES: ACP phosphodiesterase [unclassified Pseudomonas]|uniref:acyl carrier protein phosphodiesterase n=1 Tax=unclassified Pseudomonas TaxID=196821 RepID=UPI000BD542F6|nr:MULTISPECIES: ACP phosphodiesterase [unclassified Pseudomonas]PVZ16219.1 acyl carrier protein phosphodiesterase [Pseudomonas sp. URIL14HWK12:I12]PVZ25925.1 acyl carrier protein phosphodiesterase [Pseudomonas sp. URIL14HWK12:I10]PVZ36551.1 acyl carrier protein phosphodiesterase [Pseudomonas sp. URIL14HWK12:I11]SNZ13194.1 Acyl carrier protein phosphodiesterase [Pseudomonas sp. URIL14HWK12:I9]
MNYLAHLHLGGPGEQQRLGSLYGDFVKGPLEGRFSPALEASIRLHRAIDRYTDSHPLVLVALARFPKERRRFAGIVLDVFFDHCLARYWHRYCEEPLATFSASVYRLLERTDDLPGRLAQTAPHMIAHDWLGAYQRFEVLEGVFEGIGRRLSRAGALDGVMHELVQLYQPLTEDFHRFYPALQAFAAQGIQAGDATGPEAGVATGRL